MKKRVWAIVLACVLIMSLGSFAGAADETPLLIGVSKRDITPTKENGMLPIAGIGRDAGDIVDVIDHVYTRVMALQSADTTALIVVTETGKGPTGWQFAELLSEHTGVPVEAIFYTTTHVHSVPEEKNEVNFDFAEGQHESTKQLWAKYVLEQMYDACDEALASMQPASVGIAYGESYINTNRNRVYTNRETGESYTELGYNPTGVSDKTLVTMRFDDADGKPIAFLVNYAMHAVTMIANTYFDGETGISGDVPGYVSGLLEAENEGAVAFWTSGTAGDQNPISSNQVMIPVPETGDLLTYYTGDYDIMKYWASIHFADILATLDKIEETTPNLFLGFAEGNTVIPTEEGATADEFLLHLKVLRIGDIAFVGSPAELFSSIGKYMKSNAALKNTIVFNHTWTQKDANNGYIADDESRVTGGYGIGRKTFQIGYINDALTGLMNELIAAAK